MSDLPLVFDSFADDASTSDGDQSYVMLIDEPPGPSTRQQADNTLQSRTIVHPSDPGPSTIRHDSSGFAGLNKQDGKNAHNNGDHMKIKKTSNENLKPDQAINKNMGKMAAVNLKYSQNKVTTNESIDVDREKKDDIIVISDEESDTEMNVETISVNIDNNGDDDDNGDDDNNVDDDDDNNVVYKNNVDTDNNGDNDGNGDNNKNDDNNGGNEKENEEILNLNPMSGDPDNADFSEDELSIHNFLNNEADYENKVPKEIVGVTDVRGELLFLVIWEDGEQGNLVPSRIANIKWPMTVINFYERHIVFYSPPKKNKDMNGKS